MVEKREESKGFISDGNDCRCRVTTSRAMRRESFFVVDVDRSTDPTTTTVSSVPSSTLIMLSILLSTTSPVVVAVGTISKSSSSFILNPSVVITEFLIDVIGRAGKRG